MVSRTAVRCATVEWMLGERTLEAFDVDEWGADSPCPLSSTESMELDIDGHRLPSLSLSSTVVSGSCTWI